MSPSNKTKNQSKRKMNKQVKSNRFKNYCFIIIVCLLQNYFYAERIYIKKLKLKFHGFVPNNTCIIFIVVNDF